MIRVPLSNSDKVATIDDRFFYLLLLHTWSLRKSDGYIEANVNGKTTCLHLVIAKELGLKGNIDHVDRNPANNVALNLREATSSQNKANIPVRKHNKLGVKGVSYFEARQRYVARCKKVTLGYFHTIRGASDAYDYEAKRVFGAFALLNNYQGND